MREHPESFLDDSNQPCLIHQTGFWCGLNTRTVLKREAELEKQEGGVPIVAQWLTNPTRNHEVAGSVPALAQWVNNPALP